MLELDNLFDDDSGVESDSDAKAVDHSRRAKRSAKSNVKSTMDSGAGKPPPPRETIPSLPLPRHSIVDVKPATSRRDQFASRTLFLSSYGACTPSMFASLQHGILLSLRN
jgi:hypothetical protein